MTTVHDLTTSAAQPAPLDFAATWHSFADHNNRERATDEGEIAFWHRHSVGYDQGIATSPESYRETLAAILRQVRPADTVLDVGAGSGRFALPLADHVQSVTALDLSPDMLAILRDKRDRKGLTNISTIQSSWERVEVEQHDVVLAAWSLYRQPDMLACLQKLVDTTRRTLILVDGDYDERPDSDPAHELMRPAVWGASDPGLCNYLHFAGMLRQLRIRANIQVVHERFSVAKPSLDALARSYAPAEATEAEIGAFASMLAPHVEMLPDGVRYGGSFAVGLVIWQRP